MPKEIKSRREVLKAIESVSTLADLLERNDGRYEYELDMEVCVYGRNYQGKQVGPYIRLLACEPGETIIRQGDWGANALYISVDRDLDLYIQSKEGEDLWVDTIPPGCQFGELSLLAGVPRSSTIKAPEGTAARVLEIQRPALRLLRKIPFFRNSLDVVYHHHGRMAAFHAMNVPHALSDAMLWNENVGFSQFHVFSKNHVLFREGSPVEDWYVIKDGWLRRTTAAGERDYLGRGYCFGLEGLGKKATWPYTVTLLARTELLVIPIRSLEDVRSVREPLIAELSAFDPPPMGGAIPYEPAIREQVQSSQARLITTGLADATNLLVMDMELCVRCGRCSMACHEIHGQSRLVRRGIAVERLPSPPSPVRQALLAPMACLHCLDPECLTGCPTGAIGRFEDGQVDINPKMCIGCGDCAVNCPYSAISMVERAPKKAPAVSRRDRLTDLVQIRAEPLPRAVEPTENLLAVKCNLCRGTTLNPPGSKTPAYGCEENCPTGALARVNPQDYFDELKLLEGPGYLRGQSAGRNIHRSDPPIRKIHALGILLIGVLTLAAILGLRKYGFSGVFAGFLNLRWLTGLTGVIGIAGTMAYPHRRRIFRKRAGPLRYWMLGHIYLGILGAVMILIHGGTHSGGVLTTALAISFDLVILTGLWGIFCYQVVPRRLNELEPGSPLLADDLSRRYEELQRETASALRASSPAAKPVIDAATARFLSLRFLLRQFARREPLETLLADARREFQARKMRLAESNDREQTDRAIDALATLRRIDALRFFHGLLKSWLPPHIVATSIMLTLLVLHLFQVVYGTR